ncbi:hypothetical protein [Brevundimonas sp. 'scallop']|uniref:hypothetical protein n=1 Tax=Brevundimonas sp. 'scallop' TaxID=2562582 RepID=UPI0013E13651|nr:hypothetical protein [Brevundimonas sp. 'scallop']QIF81897.1 hypothetical protein E4341_09405 [Brevundimonas sp. 'scallop']
MLLKTPVETTNANAPMGDGGLSASILAMPNLMDWFQADPAHTTLVGGKVSALNGRKGVRSLAQPDAAFRAPLVEGAINGQPALENGVAPYAYGLTGTTFPSQGAWTWAMCVYEEPGDYQWMGGIFESGEMQTGIIRNADDVLRFHNKVGSGAAEIVIPNGYGRWRLIIVGASADGVIKAEVDGARLPDAVSDDAMANGALVFGALGVAGGAYAFLGGYSDIWLFTADLLGTPASLEPLRQYCRHVYGIGVA